MGMAGPESLWPTASGISARAGERERARAEAPTEPVKNLRGVAAEEAARRGALRVGVCIEAMAREELRAF